MWTCLTVENAQSHVTAFQPISEAARSWSDDNSLCPLQAYRLQRIINGKFWCIISLRYEHCLFRVDIAPEPTTGIPDQHPVILEVVQIHDLAAVRVVQEPTMAPHVDEK